MDSKRGLPGAAILFHLPSFIKEVRIDGNTWEAINRIVRRWRRDNIDNSPVRKHRNLASIIQIRIFAISKPAIDHDIFFWIQGIRINQNRNMATARK
jgi:hypothetical protein